MLKYGEVLTTQVVEVICDKCLITCQNDEYASLSAHWGYASNHDMQMYELHVCEPCFFNILKEFKNPSFVERL